MYHAVLVSVVQIIAVLQVWLVPCLLTSLQFNGVAVFYIITATLVCIPILLNLVVMSHYWSLPLLVVGLVSNGIGGAGAIASVVIAWADPKYSSGHFEAPSMSQGNVILLLVCGMTTMSAVLQMILVITSRRPDSTYSCCWGNIGDHRQRSQGNQLLHGPATRAPRKFVHLIRLMRACSFLLVLCTLGMFFGWFFAGIKTAPGQDPSHSTVLEISILSHISLFFFVTAFLWTAISFSISFNLNSARKLRFAAWNGLFVILVCLPLAIWSWFVYKRSPVGVSPSPWIMPITCLILIGWNIPAFILAYSGHQFRSNGCWWPDCTSQSQFELEFEALDDNDGL